jgi:hypothetical protein
MKKPKPILAAASVAAIVTAVLPMQDIVKLSIKEACARFAERATVSQRAFAEMGKLHFAISAHLKKGQTIYGELRKLNVKDSTISNASYAARVWGDLIAKNHLTEVDYDTFTFADCLAVCRVMGDKSKRRLTGEEVAVIVRAHPNDFDSELESIFATGHTVAEAEAQAKAAQEAAAKAEQEKKDAEAKAAADKAEADKQAAVAAALEAQRQQQGSAGVPPASPSPLDSESASAASTPTAESTPTVDSTEPAPASEPSGPALTVVPTPPPAPVPSTSAESNKPDSKVVQMPSDPDAALPEVLATCDELLATVESMSHDARKAVFAKLNDMMAVLGETLTAEAA